MDQWFGRLPDDIGPYVYSLACFFCQGRAGYVFEALGWHLCREHYDLVSGNVSAYLCCSYCGAKGNMMQCDICGQACCALHAYPMRVEVRELFSYDPDEKCVECEECVQKEVDDAALYS